MQIAMYRHRGREGFGAVVSGGIVPFDGRLEGISSIADLLGNPAALARATTLIAGATPEAKLDAVELLPLLVPGAKIMCAGLNYQAHAAEAGREGAKGQVGFFVKLPNALVGHGAPIRLPRVSSRFDFEGELCVVIGRGGRHIPQEDAYAHVAGYTILMDGSVRDYQKNFSVAAGKNFDESGAVGPWMVTTDEIPDPNRLAITTRVNGQVMQQGGCDMLIHSIPKMIAYLSGIMRLSPGDLIATGTPEGVGWHRDPQIFLKDGDLVEIEIPGIGTLANRVAPEAA